MSAPGGISSPPVGIHNGVPVVHAALGAIFHLEILSREDEERLDRVNNLVWSWLGGELRHSWLSCVDGYPQARRTDLDYISTYVQDLDLPKLREGGEEAKLAAANFAKIGRTDFSVALKGGATWAESSPISYRFWAEIPVVDLEPRLSAYGVLQLTVPDGWPLDDFLGRVTEIAAALRLRWGAAGYTYSTWYAHEWQMASARVYAHARRYLGYDVGAYERQVEDFHDRIRTVNWLTFLGPALVEALTKAGKPLSASPLVAIRPLGEEGAVLYAGGRPEAGDRNRLAYPRAYVQADAMVRPIRARDPDDMVFLGPWTKDDIGEWLCRFERHVK
ncbi:type VI immunity family protein [Sorangium sp. So ce388]|uniref:type VI immunity family protein n=1 Tax=Sorangium sp. So ce388 TaxID=3133309 RepID=UPI003F5B0A66